MTLQLTTPEAMKRPGLTDLDLTDTSFDAWLEGAIAEVSAAVEQYVGCDLTLETVTEVRSIFVQSGALWLNRRPVTSITSIDTRLSVSTAWDDAYTLSSTSYDFLESGMLAFSTFPSLGYLSTRIVYVAGLAASASDLEANHPAVASAAKRQVAHMFRRRIQPDASSVSMGGQNRNPSESVSLLPSVKESIAKFRSHVVV